MSSNQIESVGKLIAQLRTWHTQKWSGSLEIIATPQRNWQLLLREISWRIFLFKGMLVWVAGGPDPDRRWKQMSLSFLGKSASNSQLQISNSPYREYLVLAQLHQQGLITTTAATQWQKTILLERFFDLFQYMENNPGALTSKAKAQRMPPLGLSAVTPDEVYFPTWTKWQQWMKAGLKNVFPDQYVVIARPPIIFSQAITAIQQLIAEYVDGTCTLRQIAVKSDQDLLTLAQSLMPLVEAGGLSLSPTPCGRRLGEEGRAERILALKPQVSSAPLIAAIDDSPSVCRVLEEILRGAGYRTVCIQDPLTAPSTLFQTKPALILLDLLMPQINGYQLCSLLRQVSALKNTPIIFLSAKSGMLDRVRAKMVGANGYLTKPITAEKLLATIAQHLPTS